MDKERLVKALKNRMKFLNDMVALFASMKDEKARASWCTAWNEVYDIVRALESDEEFERYEKHNEELAK